MRLSIFFPGWMSELFAPLKAMGFEILENHCDERCDFLICFSVSQMDNALKFHLKYPKIKLINYNWDVYEWVWFNPRTRERDGIDEYDYIKYGGFLARSVEVWHPSLCTVHRTKQWYNLNTGIVLKCFAPLDHIKKIENIGDDNFVFSHLRQIPDPNFGWAEKACQELGIPCRSNSEKKLALGEYAQVVSRCSFLINAYHEASTGGLPLLEAYYIGKPSLISDSKWNGACDYLPPETPGIHYFKSDNFEDLKEKIKFMWENRPKLNVADCRNLIDSQYSPMAMALRMKERLHELSRI